MAEQAISKPMRARYSVVKIGEPGAELEPKDIRLFTNADETIYILEVRTEEKHPDVWLGTFYDGEEEAQIVSLIDKEERGTYEIDLWPPKKAKYVDAIISTRYGPRVLYLNDSALCREIIMDKETGSGR